MVEIRADAFTEGEENTPAENEQKINIDEFASLVAAKVVELLKAEEKAEEETNGEAEAETETEPEAEAESSADEQTEENAEEQTEETVETETEEEENRSIDYSAFERRLADIKK